MSIPYFDAHCDTITKVLENGGSLLQNNFHLDLSRLSRYSPGAQFFAIWGGRYEEKVALLKSELKGRAVFCRSASDARAAAVEGKIAAFLSVEGMEQLDCSVERLRRAYDEDGVVLVNLCWNKDNALAGSAMDSGSGLTEAGRNFVYAANELGVVLDMSHASERTFWDVLEVSSKPPIASHSNSAAVCSTFPRNLTDAQFEALVKAGGGAGINLCADFIAPNADIDDVLRHVEHFLALGGEHSLFMGADLDGIDAAPRGIEGVQDMGKIYEALLRQNYSESLVRNIFYYNLMNILERAI